MKRILLAAALVSLCVSLGFLSGCSSGSGMTVTLTSAGGQTTLQEGQSVALTATVTHATNTNVTFSLSGGTCPSNCGSLSSTTASPTTYTAPSGASVTASFMVTVTATSVADATKKASMTLMVNPVTVTVSAANNQTTLEQGQSVAMTATVANASNTGVTWSLSGASCPANCGSLSSTSTNPTTYTAPPVVAANFMVTVTATSAADASKSGSVTLTVTPAITVTITNKFATIQAATSAVTLNATVANDQNAQGVTWAIASCTSSCGSLSNATALSVMYTPPQDPPTPATVKITATSKADNTKSDSDPFTVTPHPIVVTITNKINSIVAGAAAVTFNATVAHDSTNSGVAWTLIANSVPCSPTCGSLSNATASSVTYTPPASVPSLPNNMPTLTATSVADGTKNDSDTFTITAAPPIAVTFASTPPTTLATSATAMITANVTNDSQTKGVDWTVTCGSSDCGSFNPTHTASGTATTYTAPASVPAGNTVNITATSTADNTKSVMASITITAASAACPSGNEAFLNGQYAFLVKGFDANGAVAIGGSFTADGTGKITAGEEDINRTTGVTANAGLNTASSSYTVGSDNRGCLTLVHGSTTNVFRFALSSTEGLDPLAGVDGAASSAQAALATAGKGRIIEFDDSTGTGTRGSGIIRKQDATSFAVTKISGNYAFGLTGSDLSGNRFGILGAFTATAGVFTSGSFDADDAGTLTTNASISSQVYTVASNGRGTLAVVVGATTFNYALYMVSSSEILLVGTDSISSTNPLDSGEVLQQQGSFSTSSLSGNFVLYLSGESGSGSSATSNTALVLGTVTSSGNATVTIYEDSGGTVQAPKSQSGTYAVASNGRVTLSGFGGNPPVFYLVNQSEGFVGGTDNSVTFGFLEPQAAGPFSTSSLSGAFIAGTESPSDSNVSDSIVAVNLDGNGNIAGTQDKSDSSGLTPNNPIAGETYAITNTNGTGTLGGATSILIVISPSRFVFVDESPTNTNPKMTIVEK